MTTDDDAPRTRLCICCQRRTLGASELQTCVHCVGQTRSRLIEIVQLYTWLALLRDGYPRRHSSGVNDSVRRAAGTPLVGGDDLALLAYGSDGGNAAYTDPGSRHAVDDVPSTLWELERWEADWRDVAHLPAASTAATITNTSGYLLDRLTWASQHHPAFDSFASDIRTLHGALRRACGLHQGVLRTDTLCLHCEDAVRLIRRYGEHGLEDEAECPECGRRYDERQFIEARKATLGAEREAG